MNGGRCFTRIGIGESCEFFHPESFHNGVGDFRDDRGAEGLVGEHAVDVQERRIGILQECQEGVLQNVFHSRAPRVNPDALKRSHEPRDHEVAFVVADILHHVEPDGVVGIKRREIDDVFDALVRDEVEEFLGGRAVRVDECDALAVLNVLDSHVFEQRGFTHTRLADDINVFAAVKSANAEHFAFSARVRRRKIRDTAVIILMAGSHIQHYTPKSLAHRTIDTMYKLYFSLSFLSKSSSLSIPSSMSGYCTFSSVATFGSTTSASIKAGAMSWVRYDRILSFSAKASIASMSVIITSP